MKNIDTILMLAEKENLSLAEKELLKRLIDEDPDAREFLEANDKISRLIKNSYHPSDEEIAEFILAEKESNSFDNLEVKRLKKTKEHLSKCEKCKERSLFFLSEYDELNSFLTSELNKSDKSVETSLRTSNPIFRNYAFTSLAALIVLFISAIIISNIVTPLNYKLASVNPDSETSITRGRSTSEFQRGLNAIDDGNFAEAVKYLQEDINKNVNDETIFYSYYILGLSYLENAKKDFAGLFPSYEKSYVEKGIYNLESCIKKNTSGKFPNVTLDSYFYIAKANLMLENIPEAKENLKKVIDQKGSKMAQAQKLLEELE